MPIETLEDIINEILDARQIHCGCSEDEVFGVCSEDERCSLDRPCRCHAHSELKERILAAVGSEKVNKKD